MNILLINYEYPPVGGGAANATREMARAFLALNSRPIVLTARYRGRIDAAANQGIELIEVPARRQHADRCSIVEMASFAISATLRVRRLIRHKQVDAVIAFFSIPCGPVAWWSWRKTRVPYVVSLRGGDVPGNEPGINLIHRAATPLRRVVFSHARAIVANSAGLKKAAEQKDPISVSVIPNGVDTERWRPGDHLVERLNPFKLLYVGRFQAQKNLTWLLQNVAAFPVKDRGLPWTLDMVGDGPLRAELMNQAERLGIAERVYWHGWMEQHRLLTLYQKSDLLVSAALYEGMPNAVLEAQACGLPALLSNVAGHHDLVRSGQNGWLFELNDEQSFAEALAICMGSGDVMQAVRQRARSGVVEMHSWRTVAESYIRLFENR